jgi:hypothetical protein
MRRGQRRRPLSSVGSVLVQNGRINTLSLGYGATIGAGCAYNSNTSLDILKIEHGNLTLWASDAFSNGYNFSVLLLNVTSLSLSGAPGLALAPTTRKWSSTSC